MYWCPTNFWCSCSPILIDTAQNSNQVESSLLSLRTTAFDRLSLSLSLSTKNENGHPSIRGPQRPSEKRPRRLARFLLSKFRAKVCPTILKQHHNLILHLIWNCDITDIFCASHGSPLILCYEPFDKGCPKFTRTELHIARGEGRESREQ